MINYPKPNTICWQQIPLYVVAVCCFFTLQFKNQYFSLCQFPFSPSNLIFSIFVSEGTPSLSSIIHPRPLVRFVRFSLSFRSPNPKVNFHLINKLTVCEDPNPELPLMSHTFLSFHLNLNNFEFINLNLILWFEYKISNLKRDLIDSFRFNYDPLHCCCIQHSCLCWRANMSFLIGFLFHPIMRIFQYVFNNFLSERSIFRGYRMSFDPIFRYFAMGRKFYKDFINCDRSVSFVSKSMMVFC